MVCQRKEKEKWVYSKLKDQEVQKLKIQLSYDPAIPLWGTNPDKIIIWYMHPYVHSSIIYNSHDMETTYISINRGMDKEYMVHIYIHIYGTDIQWNTMDCEESWALENWCFWTMVLEKTLESPFDCKEIQPVHSKGDEPWVFLGRNDAKAETPVLWPLHVKGWLIGEDSDAGRDWGQEEKGTTEDEMAGWHHWLDGHEFEWTPGDGDG